MTGGWSRWFAVILAINFACGCVGSSQPGGAASETILRGEVIRKEWSKSDESFNAGGSEYYVLKVPESLVPANRRTAKEGVVLLSSAAVSFGRFAELVGKEVECRGEFVDGKKFHPPPGFGRAVSRWRRNRTGWGENGSNCRCRICGQRD